MRFKPFFRDNLPTSHDYHHGAGPVTDGATRYGFIRRLDPPIPRDRGLGGICVVPGAFGQEKRAFQRFITLRGRLGLDHIPRRSVQNVFQGASGVNVNMRIYEQAVFSFDRSVRKTHFTSPIDLRAEQAPRADPVRSKTDLNEAKDAEARWLQRRNLPWFGRTSLWCAFQSTRRQPCLGSVRSVLEFAAQNPFDQLSR